MNCPDVAVVQNQFLEAVKIREGEVSLIGPSRSKKVEIIIRQVESLKGP